MTVADLAEGKPVPSQQVRSGNTSMLRVRAPGGAALVTIDAKTRTLLVWRIYATA